MSGLSLGASGLSVPLSGVRRPAPLDEEDESVTGNVDLDGQSVHGSVSVIGGVKDDDQETIDGSEEWEGEGAGGMAMDMDL